MTKTSLWKGRSSSKHIALVYINSQSSDLCDFVISPNLQIISDFPGNLRATFFVISSKW